jgi:outer membrane protein OmpA-like peptidoglycan-associated protein
MHALGGVITGLSTDPATTAQVELDGKVDEYGSARVRGSIQPFHATDFTDLTLNFHNLEMANLTPYSGKFAGRKIDSGRLSVDLEYKIKNRQLAGTNKFVINKLKLGERVESKDALHLPLDLAIALLEDSNGIIDIDLPISGSLDDPKFSYGRIIWKAIVNVLTKLVTAPFRALGHLLGISSEKLEAIDFDPGSNVLLPPEQEKLKKLSEALAKRPALALTLDPGYDPEADRRALQELAMRREADAVAGIKLAPGEAPGPVDVNNYKIQTWLEDRYAELAGKDEYRKLRASFQDKNAGVAARLMESETMERLARRFKTRDTGPISPFHTELLERLTQKTKIDDDALVKLAQARGQAMRDALLKLGLNADRISIAAPGQQTAKGKLVPSKMSLGVSKAAAPATAPAAPAAEPASSVPAISAPPGAKP